MTRYAVLYTNIRTTSYLELPLNVVLSHVLAHSRESVNRRHVSLDPRVLHDLLGGHALGRVSDQDAFNQVLCSVRDVVPERRRELKVTVFDFLEQKLIAFLIEWRETAEPYLI